MAFKTQPEILTINEIQGLSTDLQNLNTTASNLSDQTDNLGGTIPESSKNLEVNLKIKRTYGVQTYNLFYVEGNQKIDSSNPIGGYLQDIAYGNNKFLIISMDEYRGGISSDFINWTPVSLPYTNNLWRAVTYGNGKFVAISFRTNSAYSTDGITWTMTSLPDMSTYPAYYHSIRYGNGKYVAMSGYNDITSTRRVAYSTDAINWQVSTLMSNQSWNGLAFGNNKFITVAYNTNYFSYSTDGIDWFLGYLPLSSYWVNIVYDGEKFIVVSTNNNAAYSNDGITWTTTSKPLYETNRVIFLEPTISKTISEILGVE